MKSIPDQFAALALAYPGAALTVVDGLQQVMIPRMPLPTGWSLPETHIRFVIPNGYPYAVPDCFWADHSLRLASGAIPKNTQIGYVMPGQRDAQTIWFSWHVQQGTWNALNCDLMTYVKVIINRLGAVE
jgi:hypothetical protein